jgi:hypothetical protein
MNKMTRQPLSIEVLPYLRDHRALNQAVLPAVEALHFLAVSAQRHFPALDVRVMYSASFPRFLVIEDKDDVVEAYNELEVDAEGHLFAKLVTMVVSPKAGIARSRVFASVCFGTSPPDPDAGRNFSLRPLEEKVFELSSEDLYRELVPLGPAYRNAYEPIRLGRSGATACLKAPVLPAPTRPLGSPFPFDAAMHCACAWSQRFYGIIAFPVGFERRVIHDRTLPGRNYLCRIAPVSSDKGTLIFDIRIDHEQGHLCEFISGVRMRDISSGKLSPPRWIRDSA